MKLTGREFSVPPRSGRRGYTLVEVMVAATLGALVLGAVAAIIVMTTKIVYKNTMIDDSVTNTRKVQEHLNKEISMAFSQTNPPTSKILPTFTNPNTATPTRYATLTYRTVMGSYASVSNDTLKSSTTITLYCPADVQPIDGDFLMIDSPALGTGAAIATNGVSDSRAPGTAGPVTLTLTTTIDAATVTGTHADVTAGTVAYIQRERKYETIDGGSNPVTELHWFPTTASTGYLVLSRNVDNVNRYLFAPIPADPNAPEPAISWQFAYVASDASASLAGGKTATFSAGGKGNYYQANYAEGLLMPKSGNPLNAVSYAGVTTSTTTTTTSSTSSTTSSTSSSSISTTSSSTTSSTTSKTTSTTSSKTTSTSTTSSSTTSTSTTSTTSSKTTSTSTTSTSTTSKSTTSTTSTSTSKTTSSTTSTTSTTSKSTTSTTSTSTSSTSTSKTTSSTTSSTSSKTTSSTSSTTSTTSTTSTSSKSTTSTSSTTTTSSVSTSKSTTTTTTSIIFDG